MIVDLDIRFLPWANKIIDFYMTCVCDISAILWHNTLNFLSCLCAILGFYKLFTWPRNLCMWRIFEETNFVSLIPFTLPTSIFTTQKKVVKLWLEIMEILLTLVIKSIKLTSLTNGFWILHLWHCTNLVRIDLVAWKLATFCLYQ